MLSVPRAAELLERIRGLRLLVVGDVMLDHYLWGEVERISPEAPVPLVHVRQDTHVAGGAANVAMNLVALGARVSLWGRVGDDDGARLLGGLLGAAGIEFDPAAWTGPAPTIVKSRVMARHQQVCRLDREAAPAAYAWDFRARAAVGAREIAACDAVIVSDYAKGFLSSELVQWIIDTAHAHGRLVAVDPKPKGKLRHRGADLMTPNRREALQLAGLPAEAEWDAPAVCAAISAAFAPAHLVVTLGEDGMLLSSEGQPGPTIASAAREVFDVSGAGDTAIAGITLALAAGCGLPEAAHFGNAAAGVVVGKLGTATVTPKELLHHLAETPA